MEYFAPDYRLHLSPANMENLNDRDYLERNKTQILSNLSCLVAAPSVQFQEVCHGCGPCMCCRRGGGTVVGAVSSRCLSRSR
jgi:hypothetical protein